MHTDNAIEPALCLKDDLPPAAPSLDIVQLQLLLQRSVEKSALKPALFASTSSNPPPCGGVAQSAAAAATYHGSHPTCG